MRKLYDRNYFIFYPIAYYLVIFFLEFLSNSSMLSGGFLLCNKMII